MVCHRCGISAIVPIPVKPATYLPQVDPYPCYTLSPPALPASPSFMFTVVSTPTPSMKSSTATKCSKPVHLLESPAKCSKPRECNLVTCSAMKNTLISQTGDNLRLDTDMINDGSEAMVCSPFVTDTSLLTTACTDQGQCYIVGSRPLVAVS